MRLGMAALMLALLTAGAQAQVGGTSGMSPGASGSMKIGQHAASAAAKGEETKDVKANENAYNSVLKNLPNKQYDPWHGVR